MLQPVQNLSKFSFRIKSFSALSVDRRLLLSVDVSPVLKTRSLVGRPIKRQRQPFAGGVIQVENIDRFLFAYFCEASSVNTACGKSVSCIKGIKHGHNRRSAGSGRAGNLIGGCSWCQSTLVMASYIYRQASSADFRGCYQLLTVNRGCAVTSDLVKNGVLQFVKIRPAVPHTIRPEADFTG